MRTYYHNTTSDNIDNIAYGYITNFGDFVTAEERSELESRYEKNEDPIETYICQIIVESGLLYCGTFDDYHKILKKEATNFLEKK